MAKTNITIVGLIITALFACDSVNTGSEEKSTTTVLSTKKAAEQTGAKSIENKRENSAAEFKETQSKEGLPKGLEPELLEQYIAAKVDGQPISTQAVDNLVALKLHDLAWRAYELRRAALKSLISQHSSKDNTQAKSGREEAKVEILLTPPDAPRVNIKQSHHVIKGAPSAPVTLSLFCSYQSSHCARLQQVLAQLTDYYRDAINTVFYDLPQNYHRYGKSAANAVHCAAEQDAATQETARTSDLAKQWDFQAALYSNIEQLDDARFKLIAAQLQLEPLAFDRCLISKKYYPRIDADIALANSLGLGNVPVMFVNGLYVKGPQTMQGYGYYIDQELRQISQKAPIDSYLPLNLIATELSDASDQANATIAEEVSLQHFQYHQGDLLEPELRLLNIEAERVLLEHKGIHQYLSLSASAPLAAINSLVDSVPTPEVVEPNTIAMPAKKQRASRKDNGLLPSASMSLSEQWLQSQLSEQASLEQHFQAAAHEVEGVHLLKLEDVEKQEFYQVLGLRSGDVLLQVNGAWVHEQQNPLWQALQSESQVSLLVMRGGLPLRLEYKVN